MENLLARRVEARARETFYIQSVPDSRRRMCLRSETLVRGESFFFNGKRISRNKIASSVFNLEFLPTTSMSLGRDASR